MKKAPRRIFHPKVDNLKDFILQNWNGQTVRKLCEQTGYDHRTIKHTLKELDGQLDRCKITKDETKSVQPFSIDHPDIVLSKNPPIVQPSQKKRRNNESVPGKTQPNASLLRLYDEYILKNVSTLSIPEMMKNTGLEKSIIVGKITSLKSPEGKAAKNKIVKELENYILENHTTLTLNEMSDETGFQPEYIRIYCQKNGVKAKTNVKNVGRPELFNEFILENGPSMTCDELVKHTGLRMETIMRKCKKFGIHPPKLPERIRQYVTSFDGNLSAIDVATALLIDEVIVIRLCRGLGLSLKKT